MGWLQDTFPKSMHDSTEVERIRYALAYILKIIGGGTIRRVMLEYLPLLKIYDFYYTNGRKRMEFQWTPYKDPAIRVVIPD
ncbi:hypothetical protein J1N35_037162 [Gossypium stocksii]|uniref:Uncharacterized protein n=1 Tax=Gossypium stocksii TaxID=47602 RepID=A0A9D3UJM2_9ROSI|nr:hypothetical protein J1N35_037162 [Gossypium stocksii]